MIAPILTEHTPHFAPNGSEKDLNHFLEICGAGGLLPIVAGPVAATLEKHPRSKPISSPGKSPTVIRDGLISNYAWKKRHATPLDLKTWLTDGRYSFGVRCGVPLAELDGVIVAIDADSDDLAHQEQIQALIIAATGAPAAYRARSNSSRRAWLLRVTGIESFDKRILSLGQNAATGKPDAIEILGSGQQLVAVGQHASGVAYKWPAGLPNFRAMQVTATELAQLIENIKAALPVISDNVKPQRQRTAANDDAFASDPVADYLDANDFTIGYGPEGCRYIKSPFTEYSAPQGADGDTSVAYFPAGTGGHSNGMFVSLHASDAHRAQDDWLIAVGFTESLFDALPCSGMDDAEKTPQDATGAEFKAVGGWDESASAMDIIEGLISQGIGLLYGASGSYKTYALISMLGRVAMETVSWSGRRVAGGLAIYCAAEGYATIASRVNAWADECNGGQPVRQLLIWPRGVDLGNEKECTRFIASLRKVQELHGKPIRIISVDTLAQSMVSGDENSAADVSKFLQGANRVAMALNAAVVITHHAGKNANAGARGSSALAANVDNVIRVERYGKTGAVNIVPEKCRSSAIGEPLGYVCKTVNLPAHVIARRDAQSAFTSKLDENSLELGALRETERVFVDKPLPEWDNGSRAAEDAKNSFTKLQGDLLAILEANGGSMPRDAARALWNDDPAHRDENGKVIAMQFNNTVKMLMKKEAITQNTDQILTVAIELNAEDIGA